MGDMLGIAAGDKLLKLTAYLSSTRLDKHIL